jgi:hypothetical protein
MAIHLVKADIFTTGAKYIAHQVNCTTKGFAVGIAKIIFERYPYADVYKDRIEDSIPGTISIAGDGLFYRGIINMFAQYYPGKGQDDPSKFDCYKDRKVWMHQCLMAIAEIPDLNSIAFPDHIGCNLAGGDWNWYEQKINKFADYIEKKCNAEVLIYKYD